MGFRLSKCCRKTQVCPEQEKDIESEKSAVDDCNESDELDGNENISLASHMHSQGLDNGGHNYDSNRASQDSEDEGVPLLNQSQGIQGRLSDDNASRSYTQTADDDSTIFVISHNDDDKTDVAEQKQSSQSISTHDTEEEGSLAEENQSVKNVRVIYVKSYDEANNDVGNNSTDCLDNDVMLDKSNSSACDKPVDQIQNDDGSFCSINKKEDPSDDIALNKLDSSETENNNKTENGSVGNSFNDDEDNISEIEYTIYQVENTDQFDPNISSVYCGDANVAPGKSTSNELRNNNDDIKSSRQNSPSGADGHEDVIADALLRPKPVKFSSHMHLANERDMKYLDDNGANSDALFSGGSVSTNFSDDNTSEENIDGEIEYEGHDDLNTGQLRENSLEPSERNSPVLDVEGAEVKGDDILDAPTAQPNGTDEPQSVQLNKEVFLDVDPEVVAYIYDTENYRDQLNSLLDENGIQFDWTTDNNHAVIKYNGDDEKEHLRTMQSFFETFGIVDIPIKQEIWDVAKNEIFTYYSSQDVDPPRIRFLEDQSVLRVISSNDDIAYHKQRVKTILKSFKEVKFDYECISHHSKPKEYFTLLKKISFVENNIHIKCQEVQVVLDEENMKVCLKGPKEQLKIAREELLEQELAVSEEHLELPQTFLKVLNTTKAKVAIEKVLEQHMLKSVIAFTVDPHSEHLSAKVLGDSDEHAKKAVTNISELVIEKKILADQDNIALRSTPEWSELCQRIIAETEVLILNDKLSDISVVGLTDDVISSINKLQLFLNKNSIRKELFFCPSVDIKQFITENRQEDLRSIETSLIKYDVKILDGEGKTFLISGRGKGLEQSKTLLTDVINKIVVQDFKIEQPGLRKTFQRRNGDSLIKMVAQKQKCLIRIKKKFQQKKDVGGNVTTCSAATETNSDSDDESSGSGLVTSVEKPFFVTAQRHKISWKIGNIADEPVHTVVSPEGECSKAVRKNNPAISQYLGNLQVGEISVSPGFNLPCNQVIHASCSGWNSGQGEKSLRVIVQKSLHKVAETGGHSIAFPIVGTGILKFPPKESCRIMLDETLKFCRTNPRSCLKDIRFIVFHQNQGIIEAFRQEIQIVQEREEKQAMSSARLENDNKMSSLHIEVVKGDLIHEKTDAIVNMIGPDMDMNNAGELSKAIAKASGPQLQNECRQLGKQNAGSAVITTGGNLPASHVIHLIPGFGSFKDSIFTCLENCLHLAETKGLRSISLPAVGTGRYRISATESASIIFQALSKFEGRFANIQNVRIVTSKYGVRKVFLQEKKKGRPIPISRPVPAATCIADNNGVNIKILVGDLTHENTDAIFNIINTDMSMSNAGELSKAIANAAGQQVEDECKRLGQQRGGSAVMTNGGNLKVRYIIHLIPLSSDKQHLQKCLEEGLRLAERAGFQSISVPAIGTGGYGMSAVVSANMIFQALENVCKTCANIPEVRIVLLNQKLIEAFIQEQKTRKRGDREKRSTQSIRQSVKVWITGNDDKSVNNSANEIKKCFSDDFSIEEVKDDGVFILSESPKVNFFLDEAFKADVEMTIEGNRITLRGDQREVHQLALKIYQEIIQLKKEQEQQQEEENALLVAKTIDWAYELNGEKSHFDYKMNYDLEMAHRKEEPSVKVFLRGDQFVIDLKAKLGSGQHNGEQITLIRQLKQAEEIPLPEHWSVMKPEQEVVTVELDKTSTHYKDVSSKFYDTAQGVTITRIDRVQNPYRYRSYMLRKEKMDKDNGGTNERQLFHGTSAESTNAINTQGFNRNFCGKHGSLYGQGVYFARDAQYSIGYTEKEDVERRMYLARVLVGHFCEGNQEMKVPPPKDPNRPAILYDSTVNKSVNPAIFVAFSDDQCYPEYLITFQYTPPAE